MERMIFVFGSNTAGRHGKGAALEAATRHGAIRGQARGPMGNSYGIPTRKWLGPANLETLSLGVIAKEVGFFLQYAREHPELDFHVTPIGTGLAGFTRAQITPLFKFAPSNCHFKDEEGLNWRVK